MHTIALDAYRSPSSGERLSILGQAPAGRVDDGELAAPSGARYPIREGIVDFVESHALAPQDSLARKQYDAQAGAIYRNAMQWLWNAFDADERMIRGQLADFLKIEPGQRILEIGCGTGDDSSVILSRMTDGELFLQDLSLAMVRECRSRLGDENNGTRIEYSSAVASALPFVSGYFDRVFHFGGLNTFGDIAGALREMARVVKPGGRVVVGDESMAPWLRETEFGRVVINNNPLYAAKLPIDLLPATARNVSVHYILSGTFYVIVFDVGEGEPTANYDLPHQGGRGGTMRTRYYGQLEGVTLEAKDMAIRAARAEGLSLHEWLDRAVREAADSNRDRPSADVEH